MRRLVMGIGILALLLTLSAGVAWTMDRIHSPVAQRLHQAAQAADREDWAQAQQLITAAKERWEQYWHFTAAVADHTPMDDLDGLWGELEVYLQHREQPHFSATCRHLAQLAEAMADSQLPTWWNII